MKTSSNPKYRVGSVRLLEPVHTDPSHTKQQILEDTKCLVESSLNPQNKCKCNEHKDLFYRSSDSPRAPTCESQSPLRKLMATARLNYLLLPLYDHAPSWHKMAAHHNLGSQLATPQPYRSQRSKSKKQESQKSQLNSNAQGLLCSLVLSSTHSLNPTQGYTLITQSHKERLGRAQ